MGVGDGAQNVALNATRVSKGPLAPRLLYTCYCADFIRLICGQCQENLLSLVLWGLINNLSSHHVVGGCARCTCFFHCFKACSAPSLIDHPFESPVSISLGQQRTTVQNRHHITTAYFARRSRSIGYVAQTARFFLSAKFIFRPVFFAADLGVGVFLFRSIEYDESAPYVSSRRLLFFVGLFLHLFRDAICVHKKRVRVCRTCDVAEKGIEFGDGASEESETAGAILLVVRPKKSVLVRQQCRTDFCGPRLNMRSVAARGMTALRSMNNG